MILEKLAGTILAFLFFLYKKSLRFKYTGLENKKLAKKLDPYGNGSYFIALWHEDLIAGIIGHKGCPYSPIASQSKDGEIIATFLKIWGYMPVRGSSSKGGKNVTRIIMESLPQKRFFPCLTVDGPRGPRHEPKPGTIKMASSTGVAILPMSCSYEKAFTFKKSWDQNKLPLPFSTINLHYAPPLQIKKGLEGDQFENAIRDLKNALLTCKETSELNLEQWKASSHNLSHASQNTFY